MKQDICRVLTPCGTLANNYIFYPTHALTSIYRTRTASLDSTATKERRKRAFQDAAEDRPPIPASQHSNLRRVMFNLNLTPNPFAIYTLESDFCVKKKYSYSTDTETKTKTESSDGTDRATDKGKDYCTSSHPCGECYGKSLFPWIFI